MARTAFDAGVRATSPLTTASAVIALPTRPPTAHPSRRLAAAEPAGPSGRRLFGTRHTPAVAGMPSSALRRCSSQPHRQSCVGDHSRGPRPCSSDRAQSASPRRCFSPRHGSCSRQQCTRHGGALPLSPHDREGIGMRCSTAVKVSPETHGRKIGESYLFGSFPPYSIHFSLYLQWLLTFSIKHFGLTL
jgi:hypothetical protein